MLKRILVIGSAGCDSVCRVGQLPRVGEISFEGSYSQAPGGAGLVTALVMRRFGFETFLASRIGEDGEGEALQAFLRDHSIDSHFVTADPLMPTPHTVFVVEKENPAAEYRLVFCDAMNSMSVSMVENALRCHPDAVYLHLDVPSDVIEAVCRRTAEKGIPLFVNPGHCEGRFDYSVFDGTTIEIFTPDEEEVRHLTGSRLSTQDECMRACLALAKRVSANYYVIKLGERGSFLYDGTYYQFVTPYEVGVCDRTNVGEIFSAILCAAYLKNGGRIKQAMEFANAGAAISLTRQGGCSSIPKYSEILSVVSDNLN